MGVGSPPASLPPCEGGGDTSNLGGLRGYLPPSLCPPLPVGLPVRPCAPPLLTSLPRPLPPSPATPSPSARVAPVVPALTVRHRACPLSTGASVRGGVVTPFAPHPCAPPPCPCPALSGCSRGRSGSLALSGGLPAPQGRSGRLRGALRFALPSGLL